MAKFRGLIGFSETVETVPGESGVFKPVITEHKHSGDIIKNSRSLQEAEKINNDISVGVSISIVADAYAREHFFAIKYVKWAGTRWIVSNVQPKGPRLLLRLGGVYSGPHPADVPGSSSGSPAGETPGES